MRIDETKWKRKRQTTKRKKEICVISFRKVFPSNRKLFVYIPANSKLCNIFQKRNQTSKRTKSGKHWEASKFLTLPRNLIIGAETVKCERILLWNSNCCSVVAAESAAKINGGSLVVKNSDKNYQKLGALKIPWHSIYLPSKLCLVQTMRRREKLLLKAPKAHKNKW